MSYFGITNKLKKSHILIPCLILCACLFSFVKTDNAYADHRPANNAAEQSAHDLCMSGSGGGERGAIWFNTPSTSYYNDQVNIASEANLVEVYIRGSFFSCSIDGNITLNAHYINYSSYKIPRLSAVGDSTVLDRGATTSSYNFSSQGGSVSATLDVSGLAMDASKNGTVPGCDSSTSYCESLAVNLYRCPESNSPPSAKCYAVPSLTINIVREKKIIITTPTPPGGGSDGCRPIKINVNPGSDANGSPVPVTVSVGGNPLGSYSSAQSINVTNSYTTGDPYQVVYSTPQYISGYHYIEVDDGTKPIYDINGTIISYDKKKVLVTDYAPASTWSGSIGPCYDYSLTANVSALPSRAIEVGASTAVNTSVTSSSYTGANHTKSKATVWQITQFVVQSGVTISPLSNNNLGSNPCAYLGSSFSMLSCSSLQSGSSVIGINGASFPSSYTATDYEAGTKICFILSVNPNSSDTNQWNHSAFDQARNCVVVTKRPKVQIWGGNLISGGLVNTSTSVKSNNTFGSWTEYGVLANGLITGMASGSAFASKLGLATNNACDYSTLSFTNIAAGKKTCDGNIGNYVISGMAADIASSFAGSGTISSNSIIANDLISATGTYTGNRTGDLVLSASTLAAGKSVILKVSGTVTIAGDQFYENKTYHNANELPQLIIIANKIIINSGVTNVDAWLVASGTDGIIETCDTGSSTYILSGNQRLTTNKCNQLLTVNGPVLAKQLWLRRTAGSGTNANSGDPAEVFNLRADTYLWSAAYAQSSIKVQSVYTAELPPRF